MTSAADWLVAGLDFDNYEQAILELQQIQLDAMQEGMRRAAQQLLMLGVGIETVHELDGNFRAYKYRGNPVEAILASANNLTPTDL